ncbi:MAG TPA: SAM-dependent methyltransferase [Spirochaetota bacterium]|nr:SAM-dependent methyltransferase [Spirochaetota bacterium]
MMPGVDVNVKYLSVLFILILSFSQIYSREKVCAEDKRISVSGQVSSPLHLNQDDFGMLDHHTVRKMCLNGKGVRIEKEFSGVPLRNLLRLAGAPSKKTECLNGGDFIVILKNRAGRKVVLSWNEIFGGGKTDILIVTREMEDRLSALTGENFSPWLLCGNDRRYARSLYDIASIEVRELCADAAGESGQSSTLIIRDKKGHSHFIKNLREFHRLNSHVKENRSIRDVIPLASILKRDGIVLKEHDVALIKFQDGRVRAVSYGELFGDRAEDITVAEDRDGGGGFVLASADSLQNIRNAQRVRGVDIVGTESEARLHIIGIGCGDSSLVTIDAISSMVKCDVFICSDDIRKRFGRYMGGRPVLFDPFINVVGYQQKKNPHISFEECKRKVLTIRKESIKKIKMVLASGKSIGFLEYGDPALFPHWTTWLGGHVPQNKIAMRPGISALNAANAVIGGNVLGKRSLVVTVPGALCENEPLLKAAADSGDTFAIFTGLKDLKMLRKLFLKYYSEETSVLLIYRAGYRNSEKKVRTTLGKAAEDADREEEKWLGLIYIGGACNNGPSE